MTPQPPSGDLPFSPTVVPRDSSGGSRTVTGPLAVWLLLQLGAVLIAVLRWPLSANYPQEAERLALDLLLFVQIGGAAALLPLVFRDFAATAACVLCAWPFLAIGWVLSSVPVGRAAEAGLIVTLWMTALACWAGALRSRRARGILAAVASLWAIGGPLLWYLRAEFASLGVVGPFSWGFGPAMLALSVLQEEVQIVGWIALVGLLVGGILGIALARRGESGARMVEKSR